MSPRLVDVHCHLSDARMPGGPSEAARQARAVGVEHIVMAGYDREDWQTQARLAGQLSGVHAVYGVHPWVAARLAPSALALELEALRAMLAGLTPPVAIGETGLDRSPRLPSESLAAQEASFRAHLQLAREWELPVVLHVVRAHDVAQSILRELPPPGGVVHGFSGSAEVAAQYVALGLHVSFGGAITRPDRGKKARRAAISVPLERLLIETDAPDQAPQPHAAAEPGFNRPAWLPAVLNTLAGLRSMESAALADATTRNAVRLFRLA